VPADSVPCFDDKRFRLGYGGGYYDRTLATLVPFPLAVGIAFEATRLASIDPQPHDLRMDVVITDAAVY
jgi:5-formyltetrahydrofolate cyclo-ligase